MNTLTYMLLCGWRSVTSDAADRFHQGILTVGS